ncbi:unnamed protein product, partial [Discosporangium mesarthrocarpum]
GEGVIWGGGDAVSENLKQLSAPTEGFLYPPRSPPASSAPDASVASIGRVVSTDSTESKEDRSEIEAEGSKERRGREGSDLDTPSPTGTPSVLSSPFVDSNTHPCSASTHPNTHPRSARTCPNTHPCSDGANAPDSDVRAPFSSGWGCGHR